MSDFGNETTTAMMRFGEKGIEVTEEMLKKLCEILKYVTKTRERKLNKKIKMAEIEKIRQTRSITEARNYLAKSRGLVKAKYMWNSGKDLYPISQAMSPEELRRFNRLARTSGLNYYTMQNEAVIETYTEIKKELEDIESVRKRAHEEAWKQNGSKLASLQKEYADLQAAVEQKTFMSPMDRHRLNELDQGIKELKGEMEKEPLTAEQLARKGKLEQQLSILDKQRDDVIVVVFKEDLATVKDITDRMNMEIDLSDVRAEIEEIGQKDGLSETEKRRLGKLRMQETKILKGEFDTLNDRNAECIVDAALKGKAEPVAADLSFDRAIHRACDREYAATSCYLCDRNHPGNFIEAKNVQKMNGSGVPYNDTSFMVFRDNKRLEKVYHRQTSMEGTQSSHGKAIWGNMKKEIKEQGGFGEDMVIFPSKEDYLTYAEAYEKSKNSGAKEIQGETGRYKEGAQAQSKSQYWDYTGMINRLNTKLSDMDMTLNEHGAVCHSNTMQEMDVSQIHGGDGRIQAAEAINIGKQIEILKKLNDAQTKSAFILNQQQINDESFEQSDKSEGMREVYEKMRETLHKQDHEIAMQTAVYGSQLCRLEDELNDLQSIKIINDMHREEVTEEQSAETVRETDSDITHREEHTQDIAQWEHSVQGNMATGAATHGKAVEMPTPTRQE